MYTDNMTVSVNCDQIVEKAAVSAYLEYIRVNFESRFVDYIIRVYPSFTGASYVLVTDEKTFERADKYLSELKQTFPWHARYAELSVYKAFWTLRRPLAETIYETMLTTCPGDMFKSYQWDNVKKSVFQLTNIVVDSHYVKISVPYLDGNGLLGIVHRRIDRKEFNKGVYFIGLLEVVKKHFAKYFDRLLTTGQTVDSLKSA